MEDHATRRYLLLLGRANVEGRRLAYATLRERGFVVPAQYGTVAMEVEARPEEADSLMGTGLFALVTSRRVSREGIEQLRPAHARVARLWNERFTEASRQIEKDAQLDIGSWGDDARDEPTPYSELDPADVERRVAALVERLGPDVVRKRRFAPVYGRGTGIQPGKLAGDDLSVLERAYRDLGVDEQLAGELSRLVPLLTAKTARPFLSKPWLDDLVGLIAEMLAEEACWAMHGEISIGIVVVESSRSGGPKFSATKTDQMINEITGGLTWLVTQHPSNNLSWVFDIQEVAVDVGNKADLDDSNFPYDSYWAYPAMEQVSFDGNSYDGSDDGINAYREDMRIANGSKHATVIFVTSFGSSWHAYSTGKKAIVMAPNHDNLDGDISKFERIAAHEMCHKFGAKDEYTGSGSPCSNCSDLVGCDKIPNGNCGECANPFVTCVMHKKEFRLCQYTRGQIGWSDLFVELWTDEASFSGTDDGVRIDIGDRTFVLDTPSVNDRERGDRNGYAVWAGGAMKRSEIKRVLIRKDPDGAFGGWKLERVRVFHDGDVICDRSPNTWLENRRRWFVACEYDDRLVNHLRLKVTTADVWLAGTNDSVTLEMAGRAWGLDTSADDFERGDTNTFDLDPRTGLYLSDLHTITVRKSPDGVAGGWKLKGLELIVNGDTIYDNQSINKWLEDDDRWFSDAI